jgi:16S rRNA (cytosine967-C5)-methyltransferase
MPSKARICAYAVLRSVFEHSAYIEIALRRHAHGLDARDRALAMRLAYGAVQQRDTLDHLIQRLAARPLKRLDAPIVAALRLGMYELLFTGGAPDHAVVADAVEVAKAGRGHTLVNAVLRRAARDGVALLAELDDATPEGAALKHSHPEWIVRLWWEQLGADETRALLAFDNQPAELALRVNTLVAASEDVAAQLSSGPGAPGAHRDRAIPEALVLEGPWDLHGSPQWRMGAVLAQSRGAMLPARALAPAPGERVLDLCAAPGGKTTHLAALMEGRGEVVAIERNPRRAEQLRGTTARMRAAECVRVVVDDATRTFEGGAPFDRVLVDPPCTGLGTLQARADLRWRVGSRDPARVAGTQAAILAAGAAVVRPGGVLVYSTCTISAIENEQQISAFLESHRDFALDDLGAELCDQAGIGVRRGGCVQTLPHRDRTAGFFIARLRRDRRTRST